ncbi:MAG: asparagine--tRNA ligase [Elusimicrobia bacterium GWA2_61_42]|nr:MAG: asparagine--tRNA ligase [Elusimicrobia bacterium GWA2_61_42]OGR80311.1 MAG: asparagine--tRNA ligase [Elusimicrobia bacterium GWC2_61_25]
MALPTIRELLKSPAPKPGAVARGWIKTRRDSKVMSFAELNDGSCRESLQVVFAPENGNFSEVLPSLVTGAAAEIQGDLVASPAAGQKYELQAKQVKIYGGCDPEKYPIQKKKTSDEFLRTVAHLRPRTNKYAAMLRIRAELAYAVHTYFRNNGFHYVHTPILTSSDAEGAGELFTATAMDLSKLSALPKTEAGEIDFSKDLLGKKTFLTVSGQLEGETLALALGKIYTFGPTFRAENSNTYRHCAEFWQIEPEMAFYELEDDMDLAEDFIKSITRHVLENCPSDMELFAKFVEPALMENLRNVTESKYERLAYTEAVKLLEPVNERFDVKVSWGVDLSSEHERFLVEQYFKKPVILYNKPKEAAAFYMKLNDDGRTVRGMDVLVPRIGELVGGSERENRLDVLEKKLADAHIDAQAYWWYLDLRRYGSVPHSGFGLGFERMMMLITGISNIRDVTAFPRVPGYAEF